MPIYLKIIRMSVRWVEGGGERERPANGVMALSRSAEILICCSAPRSWKSKISFGWIMCNYTARPDHSQKRLMWTDYFQLYAVLCRVRLHLRSPPLLWIFCSWFVSGAFAKHSSSHTKKPNSIKLYSRTRFFDFFSSLERHSDDHKWKPHFPIRNLNSIQALEWNDEN